MTNLTIMIVASNWLDQAYSYLFIKLKVDITQNIGLSSKPDIAVEQTFREPELSQPEVTTEPTPVGNDLRRPFVKLNRIPAERKLCDKPQCRR